MIKNHKIPFVTSMALFFAVGATSPARASEIDDLKAEMRVMQQSMDQMRKRIRAVGTGKSEPETKDCCGCKNRPGPTGGRSAPSAAVD